MYMTKYFANRLYLKNKLGAFSMMEGKSLEDNTDEFNKLIVDLEHIVVIIEEKD